MSHLHKPVTSTAVVITASLGDTQLVGIPLSLHPPQWFQIGSKENAGITYTVTSIPLRLRKI